MNKKYILLILICVMVISITGCSVSKTEYDKLLQEKSALEQENTTLKNEIDELKYGESRLIENIEEAYNNEQYDNAKENILLFKERYPNSPKNEEFDSMMQAIDEKEKELIKQQNMNNTGMWIIKNYVDEFGNRTEKQYITNSSLIKGSFSNSATQDSKLNVKFLINDENNIYIQLYEYAGNNPVKPLSFEKYEVHMQDKDGAQTSFYASNRSDRLGFIDINSNKIHDALLSGGPVSFVIYETSYSTTVYKFSIENTEWYENAYRILTTGN